MINDSVHQAVLKKVQLIFNSGIGQSSLVNKSGKIQNPIPINNLDGTLNSWFVAVVIKSKIVGFMQLSQDLALLRYSSFQRNPLIIDDCPEAQTWLNKNYIFERAKEKSSPTDKLEPPFLSYDKSPERITWIVRVTNSIGRKKLIFVAGDYVYLQVMERQR